MAKHRLVFDLNQVSSFSRGIARGVADYLNGRNDWRFTFFNPLTPDDLDGLPEPPTAILGMFNQAVVDHWPADRRDRLINVSRGSFVPGGVNVCCDDDAIGREAARYLLDKGLEHFAFVGVKGSGRRYESFAEAIADAGYDTPYHDLRALEKHDQPLLDLPRPCGVLCFNDPVAVVVIERCEELQIATPRDVAVVGVDNDPFVTAFAPVSITSVHVDFWEVGREAMRQLDRVMEGHPPPAEAIRFPPTRVVERHSSDFPGNMDPIAVEAARRLRRRAFARLTVPEVVAGLPVAYSTIDRRFRKAFGHAMGEEVARVRTEAACRLLRETNLPIAAIAPRVSYRDADYFKSVFRKRTGTPPGAYRKQFRDPVGRVIDAIDLETPED